MPTACPGFNPNRYVRAPNRSPKNQSTDHDRKQHLLQTLSFERLEELGPDTITYAEKEKKKRHGLKRSADGNVELPDEHTDNKHGGHRAQGYALEFKFTEPESQSYRKKYG